MRQAIAYGDGGASDVDQRQGSLQLVVAGLMEEVAETDDARSFSDEVHGEADRRAAEDANHRIEFLAAMLQIGTRHREVGGIQRGRGGEQGTVPLVPESMLIPLAGWRV